MEKIKICLQDICYPDYFQGVSSMDKQREVIAVYVSPRMRYSALLKGLLLEIGVTDFYPFSDDIPGFYEMAQKAAKDCFSRIDKRTTIPESIPQEKDFDPDDWDLCAYFVLEIY